MFELLGRMTASLETSGLEATIHLDAPDVQRIQAEHPDLAKSLRRQNIAYQTDSLADAPLSYLRRLPWKEGAAAFIETEMKGFNSSCWLGAALPVAVSMRGWAPQPFAALAEWGVRAILGPSTFLADYDRPYFLCGRLHLASLGPNAIQLEPDDWLVPAGVLASIERIHHRARILAPAASVLVLRLPLHDSLKSRAESTQTLAGHFVGLVDRLRALPEIELQSARQVVDRFADISYEHAVPADVFKEVACWAWSGNLRPFYYEQGFLSPAEQLYGMARLWHESLQKGKPVRNTTIKTPLGPPERAITDSSVEEISAEEVPALLASLMNTMENEGQLPSAVPIKSGRLAIHDLLPTLAGGLNPKMELQDMPVHRGSFDETRISPLRIAECLRDSGLPADTDVANITELARLQLWTYKPVIGCG